MRLQSAVRETGKAYGIGEEEISRVIVARDPTTGIQTRAAETNARLRMC